MDPWDLELEANEECPKPRFYVVNILDVWVDPVYNTKHNNVDADFPKPLGILEDGGQNMSH